MGVKNSLDVDGMFQFGKRLLR